MTYKNIDAIDGGGGGAGHGTMPPTQRKHPARGKFLVQNEGGVVPLEKFLGKKAAVREVRELMELVSGVGGEASAAVARGVLGKVVIEAVTGLTAFGEKDGDTGEWARGVLACVDVWIEKHAEGMGCGYEAKRRVVRRKLQKDVLRPSGPLYRALHVELWKCWVIRGEMELSAVAGLRPGEFGGMPDGVRGMVPEGYEWVLGLPRLSVASWKEWDAGLWLLVKQNNPGLGEELQKRYKRVEGRLSRRRKEFRRHLKRLAESLSG